MSAAAHDAGSSESSSGYEDGLGRRVLTIDRESGDMYERLRLRPELKAFARALEDRLSIVAAIEDERFGRPRAIEPGLDGRLSVVSDYIAGRRLSDILEAALEQGIVGGLDAGLGLLLELLPNLSRLHDAGITHGALGPGRIIITADSQIAIVDAIYGEALERLQLTRMRLWSELGLAFPATAGAPRFDKAADLTQAALTAAAVIVGRPLRSDEYPEGLATLREEILEIASIRASKAFADGVDRFFTGTLPLATRRTALASADEAAIDLRKLLRKDVGINTCHNALLEFFQQVETAERDHAAFAAEAYARVAAERAEAERAERLEAERIELERAARAEAARRERERLEAERAERERLEAEARARAREEAERQEREEAERRGREEAERRAREEALRKELERLEAERQAHEEAERRAREEAERRRREREEAERRAREEAERRAREEAERRAREEAERRAREEAERKAREEAERRARAEAERKAREEAERRAREEAERKARAEAERKAREEAERKAREEAERKAREEAERKARAEAERKAREEAERKAREEAERKAREEAERKARAEAERKAREEAERKAREEAERKARAEAERKAREEAERKAREEAERKAREEAERKARAEAERKAREEAERKARAEAERKAREEAERKAREEAERKARAEAERKAREEADRRARAEVERAQRERAEAERRERERLEQEAREREERERAAAQAATSDGWLVPPDKAAAFEPVVDNEPPPPPPTTRAYPIYEPAPETESWTPEAAAPPTFEISPVAARPPAPSIRLQGPPPATSIRVKDEPPSQASAPSRADSRHEPEELSAAGAYEPFTYRPETQTIPWKWIAAGVAVIVVGFGAATIFWPSSTPAPAPKKVEADTAKAAPAPPPPPAGFGRVTITTNPPGVKVLVDGKNAGVTPMTIDKIAPGKHVLTLQGSGGSLKRPIRVESGQTLTVDASVYPGLVEFSAPFVVEIAENGKALGTSVSQIILGPGHHVLRLENRDLEYSATQGVDIEPGETAHVALDPRGRANINAAPWAEVLIDGESAGQTPLANVPIRLGVREIVFKNPQFPERKIVTTIKGGPAATISVDFNKDR